jgi:hypothetical protein
MKIKQIVFQFDKQTNARNFWFDDRTRGCVWSSETNCSQFSRVQSAMLRTIEENIQDLDAKYHAITQKGKGEIKLSCIINCVISKQILYMPTLCPWILNFRQTSAKAQYCLPDFKNINSCIEVKGNVTVYWRAKYSVQCYERCATSHGCCAVTTQLLW